MTTNDDDFVKAVDVVARQIEDSIMGCECDTCSAAWPAALARLVRRVSPPGAEHEVLVMAQRLADARVTDMLARARDIIGPETH